MNENYYTFHAKQILDYLLTKFELENLKERKVIHDYEINQVDSDDATTYNVYIKPLVSCEHIKVNFEIKCGE